METKGIHKILIITTSRLEYKSIQKTFKNLKSLDERKSITEQGPFSVTFVRSDPGIFSLSYFLSRELAGDRYDLIINAGICGSYRHDLVPGDVVRVTADLFADIGTEEGKDIFEMGLMDRHTYPFTDGLIKENPGDLIPIPGDLGKVKAITVNRVSVTDLNIAYLSTKYRPDIETMEGAAFFYICAMENINFIQLRSISNRVGIRDKDEWETKKALDSLVEVLKAILTA